MIKYEIHARTEARSDEDAASVHARVFQHLKAHSKMCADGIIPVLKKPQVGESMATCTLKGFLPKGMTGRVVYRFMTRSAITPYSPYSGEDWITIKFKPDTRLYQEVIDEFIPDLIRAMDPYTVTMGDQQFDEPLVEPNGSIRVGGPRACGCWLHPVFFFADGWLERVCQINLEQGLKALAPVAERVSIMEKGLYVVGSSQVTDFEEARAQVLRMEERLYYAKPGLFRFLKSLFAKRR